MYWYAVWDKVSDEVKALAKEHKISDKDFKEWVFENKGRFNFDIKLVEYKEYEKGFETWLILEE